MNLRLKTNIDVELKLSELQNALQLSSKAAVIRLAIAFSIRLDGDPRMIDGEIVKYDVRKQNGADYNRFTIFGKDELIYKALMEQQMKKFLEEDEFYPEMTNAHLNRGIIELYGDFKLAGNKEKFLQNLL